MTVSFPGSLTNIFFYIYWSLDIIFVLQSTWKRGWVAECDKSSVCTQIASNGLWFDPQTVPIYLSIFQASIKKIHILGWSYFNSICNHEPMRIDHDFDNLETIMRLWWTQKSLAWKWELLVKTISKLFIINNFDKTAITNSCQITTTSFCSLLVILPRMKTILWGPSKRFDPF